MPPEAALRQCILAQVRGLKSAASRSPSFDEAMKIAEHCDSSMVPREEVKTISCALSGQWNRCGRRPPTD